VVGGCYVSKRCMNRYCDLSFVDGTRYEHLPIRVGGGGFVVYVSFLMWVQIGIAIECGAFSLRR